MAKKESDKARRLRVENEMMALWERQVDALERIANGIEAAGPVEETQSVPGLDLSEQAT